jgi:succinoglycan biosynthesis protein ExoL
LENRVYPSTGIVLPAAPAGGIAAKPVPVCGGRPWVIGLFGALRCPRSLSLMRAIALRFPDRVYFYLRGYPSGIDPAVTASLLGGLPNLEWAGAYQYPDDLASMYRQIDLNWTMDYSDPSGNSPLLLPNRIYEGGLFGCPALGDASAETGRWIDQHGTGWTFAEPLEETVGQFLENLTETAWQEKKAASAQLPRSLTCGEQDYADLSTAIRSLAGC